MAKKLKTNKSLILKRVDRVLRGKVSSKIPATKFLPQDVRLSTNQMQTTSGVYVGRNYIAREFGSYGGVTNRLARYSDFELMDNDSPIIRSALDIYTANICIRNETGDYIQILSDNSKIKHELNHLFFGKLNIEYNLRQIARSLVKYGDHFAITPLVPGEGVVDFLQLIPREVEIENTLVEGRYKIYYKWAGNNKRKYTGYDMSHFKLVGDPLLQPFGMSILDGARRTWKQLKMLEDAMMIYKISRAPEARIYKIDVGNISPEKVPQFIEGVMSKVKRQSLVDETGNINNKFSPMSIVEDIVLPVRSEKSSADVSTLPGVQGFGLEELEYIQKQLFAALKIPKAYLTYDEDIRTKATLLREDSRFATYIENIQTAILNELNKIAVIHLLVKGFTEEESMNFVLKMPKPSLADESMRIQALSEKVNFIQSAMDTGIMSREQLQRTIFGMSKQEIATAIAQRITEAEMDHVIEKIKGDGKQTIQGYMSSPGDVDRATIRRLMFSQRPGEGSGEASAEGGGEEAGGLFGDEGGGDEGGGLFGGGEEAGGDEGGGTEEASDAFSNVTPASELIPKNKKKRFIEQNIIDELYSLIDDIDEVEGES